MAKGYDKGKEKGEGKDGKATGKGTGSEKQDSAMKFECCCSNQQQEHGANGRTAGQQEDVSTVKARTKPWAKERTSTAIRRGKGKNANSMNRRRKNWNELQQQNLEQQPALQPAAVGCFKLCSLQFQRPAQAPGGGVGTERDDGNTALAWLDNVGEVFDFAAPASGFKYNISDGRAIVQDQRQDKAESGH